MRRMRWMMVAGVMGVAASAENIGGVVRDETGEGMAGATVTAVETGETVMVGEDGRYVLGQLPQGRHTLRAECLGRITAGREIVVTGAAKDIKADFVLNPMTFTLEGFSVMGQKGEGGEVRIGQAALEYTQPSSLTDVLLLVPGSVYAKENMSGFAPLTSRQAGSDDNSGLGVSIVGDGIPSGNDGIRRQMVGITGGATGSSSDTEIKARTGTNAGSDARMIATDHIGDVEVRRGISSARDGNMTSGTIKINSKKGVSPLKIRAKTDLRDKLLYAGKGFGLPGHGGTLYVGGDYLRSATDPREAMDVFSRATVQTYYNNKFFMDNGHGEKKTLEIEGKLAQTFSLNEMKKDELTYEYEERYKAHYEKTDLMGAAHLTLGKGWVEQVNASLAVARVRDNITRHRMVISGQGPMSMPLAHEEGEHEGIYLPGKYYSDFHIENIPVDLYAHADFTERRTGRKITLSAEYGIDLRRTKNRGDGAVIEDETRPPFPYDNAYMRPRRNKDIPAIGHVAGYIATEGLWMMSDKQRLKLQLGGRVTSMMNLPKDYDLRGKVMREPRVQLLYGVGKRWRGNLRIGYGMEYKLPTMDYLYPEKVYKDFYMLNAYTNNPEYRHLITYTTVYDMTNKHLKAMKNNKMEVGLDVKFKGAEADVSVFREYTRTGFAYCTTYAPMVYTRYGTLREGVATDHRLEKADYIAEEYGTWTLVERVMNAKKTEKRGMEYRIATPRINAIATSVEVSGAYYKTRYGTTLPKEMHPSGLVNGRTYPYVGVYDLDPVTEKTRGNTNVWLNTHLPKWGLMFTNFVGIIWAETTRYDDSRARYPYAVKDLSGNLYPVTAETLALIDSRDEVWKYLKNNPMTLDYAKDKKPVSVRWNFKATKEIARAVKVSAFVDGIIDHHPTYRAGNKKKDRQWSDPFFGLEVIVQPGMKTAKTPKR